MPGGGIAAAAEITRALPDTAVVMLTASQDDEDLFAALRSGASGYLLKDMDPDRLGAALRGVLTGEAALPRWLAARVIAEFRAPAPSRWSRRSTAADKLSRREREVMEALGRGRTTDEVARELFLSPTTVRVHVSAVLRKLRVKDRESAFALLEGDDPHSTPS
jgi:DNA-binding NarL/FixJ family response regulator